MRRPESCLSVQVVECEDCEHWEPIPYLARGGECLMDVAPLRPGGEPAFALSVRFDQVPSGMRG